MKGKDNKKEKRTAFIEKFRIEPSIKVALEEQAILTDRKFNDYLRHVLKKSIPQKQ